MNEKRSGSFFTESTRAFHVGDFVQIKGSPADGRRGHVIHCLSQRRYGVAMTWTMNGTPLTTAVVYSEHELMRIAEA